MALPTPPAGIARVACKGHLFTSEWVNTFWLQCFGFEAAESSDLATLATDIAGSYGENFMPLMSSDSELDEVTIQLWLGDDSIIGAATVALLGSQEPPTLTAGVALVVSWHIAASYRGGHPRTYFGGQPFAGLANEVAWGSGWTSSWSSAAAAFLGDVNGFSTPNIDTVTLGTLSRVRGGVPRTPAIFYPYFSAIARPGIGSIRGRNDYHT